MQLIEACPLDIADNHYLINLLHVLVAAESEATVQYDQVIEACKDESVKKALIEIRDDELNHTGILISLLSRLDKNIAVKMVEGVNETE